MSQKTITVGTSGSPADLDINFGNTQDNFTELYPAVALNTAKVSFDTISSARLTNTSGANTGDQNLSAYALKAIATAVKSGAYTVGNDDSAEPYGGVIYQSSTGVISLPVIAIGMSLSVIMTAAVVGTIDPDGTEKILLDGVDAGAGVTIVSPGAVGDIAVLTYYGAGVWYASTNSWTTGV